jgi:hypothetical protein
MAQPQAFLQKVGPLAIPQVRQQLLLLEVYPTLKLLMELVIPYLPLILMMMAQFL